MFAVFNAMNNLNLSIICVLFLEQQLTLSLKRTDDSPSIGNFETTMANWLENDSFQLTEEFC